MYLQDQPLHGLELGSLSVSPASDSCPVAHNMLSSFPSSKVKSKKKTKQSRSFILLFNTTTDRNLFPQRTALCGAALQGACLDLGTTFEEFSAASARHLLIWSHDAVREVIL